MVSFASSQKCPSFTEGLAIQVSYPYITCISGVLQLVDEMVWRVQDSFIPTDVLSPGGDDYGLDGSR